MNPALIRSTPAGLVFVALASARGGAAVRRPVPVPVRQLARCHKSGIRTRGLTVVRTPERWRAVWPQLVRLGPGACGDSAPPPVDFGREVVLVVAFGYSGADQADLAVTGVVRRGDTTYVSAVRYEPGASHRGCPVSPALSFPAAAVAVPAGSGPILLAERVRPVAMCR